MEYCTCLEDNLRVLKWSMLSLQAKFANRKPISYTLSCCDTPSSTYLIMRDERYEYKYIYYYFYLWRTIGIHIFDVDISFVRCFLLKSQWDYLLKYLKEIMKYKDFLFIASD